MDIDHLAQAEEDGGRQFRAWNGHKSTARKGDSCWRKSCDAWPRASAGCIELSRVASGKASTTTVTAADRQGILFVPYLLRAVEEIEAQ